MGYTLGVRFLPMPTGNGLTGTFWRVVCQGYSDLTVSARGGLHFTDRDALVVEISAMWLSIPDVQSRREVSG